MIRALLFVILLTAPHIQFPGMGNPYPFRPVDVVILVTIILLIYSAKINKNSNYKIMRAICVCFAVSVVSGIWGSYYLSTRHLDILSLNGTSIYYEIFVIRKLMLLLICFTGFYVLAYSRETTTHALLKFWFYGLASASAIHIITYVITRNPMIMRAGVFMEGNFGGSYYLLSFFLMWIAENQHYRFGRPGMILAIIGIFLSQSTSAILIFGLLSIGALLFKKSPNFGQLRWKISSFAFAAVLLIFGIAFFGKDITEKLFGEDLNSLSYSRYDRIATITAGLSMFYDSPLFGVGIQGYAFALPNHTNEWLINSFFDFDIRRIINNIYIELLAEQGIVGASAMLYLLFQVMKTAFRSETRNILVSLGFISVLASWLAFPSYTISFHWLGFGLLYRITTGDPALRTNS